MKIYDCFMFFDEEMILDLRLNILDKYVDKFIITEATYMHSGKPKKLLFDIQIAATLQLIYSGIMKDQIHINRLCTFSNPKLFNSWRRDKSKVVQWNFIAN